MRDSEDNSENDEWFVPTLELNYGTHGLGQIDSDRLPEDYTRVRVGRQYLQEMLDVAEVLGWDELVFSLMSDWPVLIQNDQADDKPTLIVCPRVSPEKELELFDD